MRLYEGTVQQFRTDIIQNKLTDILKLNYENYYNKRVNTSESNSWNVSLNFLKNALEYSELKDNKIVVEYELPYSSRRIDVLLFGRNTSNTDNIVLIELKQWSNDKVEDCEVEGNVVVDFGTRKSQHPHPSLQVQGYHFDLKDFIHVFEEKPSISLNSCAYCHNYSRTGVDPVLYYSKFDPYLREFPLFSKEDITALGAYLKERLQNGSGLEVFNRFITSTIKPSKKLLEHTREMINKQQIFNLIDDQIAAYNAIMHKAKELVKLKKKSVIIVKGGPGTGKSVIALEVMGELLRKGKTVFHATGSSAFTNTLRKILGTRSRNLFKFFFNFTKRKENEIDVIICDEAHRIRRDSNDYGVPFSSRSGNPQVDDLIKPAKLSVFFIDEHQIVRPKEIGSVKLIKESAKRMGVKDEEIAEFELKTQFRCSGSDGYLQWLENTLGIRESEMQYLTENDRMDFRIFNDPFQLKKAVDEKNREKKNCARIVAGFCWPWSEPNKDGTLVKDVVIGDFKMPWEQKDQFWKWATDDSGMDQVGTVYTAQGFEFDYIGVIFSNDLIYDPVKSKWIGIPEKSYDSMVKKNNSTLTEHLQNVYRVLMSRAHKGCFVYFMDKNTGNFFKSRIKKDVTVQIPAMEEAPVSERLIASGAQIKERIFKDLLPVYSLQGACGKFIEGKEEECIGRLEVKGIRLDKKMFIIQAVGKSMEPIIPDGSYCIFRAEPVGSREGKIVLVKSNRPIDPDFGEVTIKKYHSEKENFDDGTWRHKKIILSPLNPDHEPIVLEDIAPDDFKVVAEFIKIV